MKGIEVRLHAESPIDAKLVRELYQHVGWWPNRTEEAIRKVLDMAPAVGAWDGDRLVGFARVITDGLFHAYVEDVAVHEAYRQRGVATALLAHLLDAVRETHIVSLFCSAKLAPLYEAQGFQATKQVMMHRLGQQSESGS